MFATSAARGEHVNSLIAAQAKGRRPESDDKAFLEMAEAKASGILNTHLTSASVGSLKSKIISSFG